MMTFGQGTRRISGSLTEIRKARLVAGIGKDGEFNG